MKNNRLIVLTIVIFILFIILILKLTSIQVLNKDKYIKKLDSLTVSEVYSTSTPRGRIYDRNYNLLVDNIGVKTIYYKRQKGITTKEEIAISYKLAKNIDVDFSKLEKINLKEFYMVNNKEKVNK